MYSCKATIKIDVQNYKNKCVSKWNLEKQISEFTYWPGFIYKAILILKNN